MTMTREQLWAQYAAAALSGMLTNEYSPNQQAMAFDADIAGNYADAMLAEHLHRFPQDQQGAEFIEWFGGDCPVDPLVEVDAILRGGERRTAPAGSLQWLFGSQYSSDEVIYYIPNYCR